MRLAFAGINKGGDYVKILSCGAGMQSTAMALMSCENALAIKEGRDIPNAEIPVYDLVIFCDLGLEPAWVATQWEFIKDACDKAGIPHKTLDTDLYGHLMANFGERRTVSIPWWTLGDDGKKSKMPRNCTIDFKVEMISKYIRWEVLGYRKKQRLQEYDKKAHEMHMGFSLEEKRRCKPSPNPMFINKFPLVDMGWTRANSYAYCLDVWDLKTKASSCTFCPYHTNHFYQYLKENNPDDYAAVVEVDHLLRDKNPKPPMDSDLYISRSRKRLQELTPEECNDYKTFLYNDQEVWDGF